MANTAKVVSNMPDTTIVLNPASIWKSKCDAQYLASI